MTNEEETFEELLKKSKENAGVETLRNIQAHIHKHQKSQHKITWQRRLITSSDTFS